MSNDKTDGTEQTPEQVEALAAEATSAIATMTHNFSERNIRAAIHHAETLVSHLDAALESPSQETAGETGGEADARPNPPTVFHYHAVLTCGHKVAFDVNHDLIQGTIDEGGDDFVVDLPCAKCGKERRSREVLPGGENVTLCGTCGKGRT